MKKNKKEATVTDQELLLGALVDLEKKGIKKDTLIAVIKNSLLTAYKTHVGAEHTDNVRVELNNETGLYAVYVDLTVVDDVLDPFVEIDLEEAKKINSRYELGGIVTKEVDSKAFGRIATQNAKNMILQAIREQERSSIYEEYSAKERDIITGIIQRYNNTDITIDLGRTDAIMKESEQVKTEEYKPTERLKVLVVEVKNNSRGPRIFVSRTHPDLVKRLFEAEVTEIQDGIVEIKAVSREAGSRTKMAVWSNDENVDPIGACVGEKGSRVNAVVEELCGEKIDIINWSENSAELIENALSPAQVICVLADDDEKTALVVVPDQQLSLAIGKMGQNVRLAVKLTNYKIDIKSETQARESGLFEEIGYIEDYEEDESEDEMYEEEQYEEEQYEEEAPQDAE